MELKDPVTRLPDWELINLNRCPVCQGVDRQRVFIISHSSVYDCEGCGLRYLDPCLSPTAMQSAYQSNENLVNLHGFHDGYYDYGDLSIKTKTLAVRTMVVDRIPIGAILLVPPRRRTIVVPSPHDVVQSERSHVVD